MQAGMQTVPWLDERESAAWAAVLLLGQPLLSALGRDLQQDCGLSMADYHVLVVLSENPDDVTAYRHLAASTGWEKSRLSHQVTRMERRGLLRREGCHDDGRTANIGLTDEGRTVIEAAAPGHVAAVRRLLIDRLDDREMDLLISIADRVAAAIAEEPSTDRASGGDQA